MKSAALWRGRELYLHQQPNMEITSIKETIDSIHKKWLLLDDSDINIAEICEFEIEDLLLNHAVSLGFVLPKVSDTDVDSDFNLQKRQSQLAEIAKNNTEISELLWYYISLFWPDCYDSKNEMIAELITLKE